MSLASQDHPKTLRPQRPEDVVVYVDWKSQDAHAEALRKNDEWTSARPSGLATVGRYLAHRGSPGPSRGVRFDYRVDGLVEPYPKRSGDVPTVVQPASALARVKPLHGLVDGIVLGEKSNEWRRRSDTEGSS